MTTSPEMMSSAFPSPLLPAFWSLLSAVAGALLRLLLSRLLREGTSKQRSWTAEALVAVLLGAGVAVPLTAMSGVSWTVGGVGAGLTTYAAASGMLAYIGARRESVSPLMPMVSHFLLAIASAAAGFLAIFAMVKLS